MVIKNSGSAKLLNLEYYRNPFVHNNYFRVYSFKYHKEDENAMISLWVMFGNESNQLYNNYMMPIQCLYNAYTSTIRYCIVDV